MVDVLLVLLTASGIMCMPIMAISIRPFRLMVHLRSQVQARFPEAYRSGASLSGDIVINNTLYFGSDKTVKMNLYDSGIDVTGHLTPVRWSTYNLGSYSYPWERLYVNYISGSGVAKSIAGYGTGTSQDSTYPIGSLILAKLTTATNSGSASLSSNTWYNSTDIGDVSASKLKPAALYSDDGGTTTGKTYTSTLPYGTWRILGRVYSSNMSSYFPTVLVVRIA